MKNLHKFMFCFLAASSFSSIVAMHSDDLEERKIIFQKVPDNIIIKQYLLDRINKEKPDNSFYYVHTFEKYFVWEIYGVELEVFNKILTKMASSNLSDEETTIINTYHSTVRFDENWEKQNFCSTKYHTQGLMGDCEESQEAAKSLVTALYATRENKLKIREEITAYRAKKQQQK